MYDLIMQVYATVLLSSSWNYAKKIKINRGEMAQLIKAPSTLIRFQTKTELFCSG